MLLVLPVLLFVSLSSAGPHPAELARFENLLARLDRALSSSSSSNCPPTPGYVPGVAPDSAVMEAIANITSLAKSTVQAPFSPSGAVFSVRYGATRWMDLSLGTVNGTGSPPMDIDDTVFRVASVSKVVTALCAVAAVETGSVPSLDVKLSELNPLFSVLPPARGSDAGPGEPTLASLFSHQAGLPREAPCAPSGLNLCPQSTSEMLDKIAKETAMISPTWRRPSYSNLGFSLLGHLSAEAAKVPFSEWAQTRVMAPLGMATSSFDLNDPAFLAKMAVGQLPRGSPVPLFDLGWSAPAGGLGTTAADLERLLDAFVGAWHGDAVPAPLSSEALRRMAQGKWDNPSGRTGISTPWEVLIVEGYHVLTKGGSLEGWSSMITMIPDLRLTSVSLWNGGIDSDAYARAIHTNLLPPLVALLSAKTPGPVPAPAGTPDLTGQYTLTPATPTAQAVVVNSPTYGLVVTYSGFSIPISFVASKNGSTTLVFTLFVPSHLMKCLTGELLGLDNQTLEFTVNSQGSKEAISFTIPGMFPSAVFTKM
jgi:CubicO group peptidase (beta-lactamase class C family)